MSETKLRPKARLLPYPVIAAASKGNADAIATVLKHYEGYITALSTRRLFDEYGNPVVCVDDDIRRRLEAKLITKVLEFNTD